MPLPTIELDGENQTLTLEFPDTPEFELELRHVYKGDPGVPGPAGDAELYTTTQAIGGYRCIYFAADGTLQYADSAQISHARRIGGVTRQAYNAGEGVDLLRFAELEDATWNWNTSLPVFLGHNGVFTQTVPAAPDAAFLLVLGMPISATKLLINVRDPLVLQ